MNADAEFIKLLKDEADSFENERKRLEENPYPYRAHYYHGRLEQALYSLKHLGITYTPNSRK